MVTTLYSGTTPTRVIHVTVGTGTGDGSLANPFHSIQAAVNAATPGTAIVVHAGVYNENVKIDYRSSGTSTAPIWLISGDGAQKATIVGLDTTKPVIQALGGDNYVIEGFAIKGGYDGIQLSQSGRDFSNLVHNILIQGNVITGAAHDGIKVGQADNVQILDNKIANMAGEEGIDFVAVNNALIAHNELFNITNTTAAIFAKGGSTNVTVVDNYIHDVTGDGVAAGGNTDITSFVPGYSGYEAKNVLVDGNRIENVGKRPVSVRGAINVDITNNFLEASSKYGNAVYITSGSQNQTVPVYSSDVQILKNVVAAVTSLVRIDAGNNNLIVTSGNGAGTYTHNVGTEPLILPSWLSSTTGSTTPTPTPTATTTTTTSVVPASTARDSAAPTKAILGTVNADTLTGTTGADRIDGLNNIDTMSGGKGDDTYVASVYRDVVIELAGEGTDTVELYDKRYFLSANVENLVAKLTVDTLLVGNGLDNKLTGNSGSDTILGGAGQDMVTGGAGADHFIIGRGDGSDVITDLKTDDVVHIAGSQFDSFASLTTAAVQIGADVRVTMGNGQFLTLQRVQLSALTAAQFGLDTLLTTATVSAASTSTFTGTKQAEHLIGTTGADLIDGVGGGDVLAGGLGDDSYAIRNVADAIVEISGGGIDTAHVYITNYALAAKVENATAMTSSATRLEGNAEANILIGNAGADTLIGAGGDDVLTGGAGKDTFVFLDLKGGSDFVTDFKSGEDRIDLSAIRDAYAIGTISHVATSQGMEIYFDHGTQHDLIVTLSGVSTYVASDFIF